VADWLKTLIDKAQYRRDYGLERTQIILDANEQLRRRFCRRIDLKPLIWNALLAVVTFLASSRKLMVH